MKFWLQSQGRQQRIRFSNLIQLDQADWTKVLTAIDQNSLSLALMALPQLEQEHFLRILSDIAPDIKNIKMPYAQTADSLTSQESIVGSVIHLIEKLQIKNPWASFHVDKSLPKQGPDDLWSRTLDILEMEIRPESYSTWIIPLKPLRIESDSMGFKLHIKGPNAFSVNWVKSQYKKSIENALSKVVGENTVIELIGRRTLKSSRNISNEVDPRYTFSTFIHGPSNEEAYLAAKGLAASEKWKSPLFLYSMPGMGKTHLLHSIANEHLARNPKSRIHLIRREDFQIELRKAIDNSNLPGFRSKYRSKADLIVVDDFSFYEPRAFTEELLLGLQELSDSGCKIAIGTSDPEWKPTPLPSVLKPWLDSACIAKISYPTQASRHKFVCQIVRRDHIDIPTEVIDFIAAETMTSFRQLEGCLIHLQARSSLDGLPIDLEMAKEVCKESFSET